MTVSVSKKHFSLGFNMMTWMNEPENYNASLNALRKLFDRIIRLSLPSMAVVNGNCMAGGYLVAICHDFRMMNSEQG